MGDLENSSTSLCGELLQGWPQLQGATLTAVTAFPGQAHIWRRSMCGTCRLDNSDRQCSHQSCLQGRPHQFPLIQTCFLFLLCTCIDSEKTSRSPHSVSASASRELSLLCERNAPLCPVSGLPTVHCLRVLQLSGWQSDNAEYWCCCCCTKEVSIPTYSYKPVFSAFISINFKHRNRFGAEPCLILGNTHPRIHELIGRNKTPSISYR